MTAAPHEHLLRGCLLWCAAGVFAMLCVGVAIALTIERAENRRVAPTGFLGDPERGRALVGAYGCVSCHDVGNGATPGKVGPSLRNVGARSYLAGEFPNIPGVMVQWIRYPRELKPGTAMPDLGVDRRDGEDIAAYLGTLR